MASDISTHLERLESAVLAMENLSELVPSHDTNAALAYCNVHHYLATQLSLHFNALQMAITSQEVVS